MVELLFGKRTSGIPFLRTGIVFNHTGGKFPITPLQAYLKSKRQIIGVYKRSAACDIVQLEHLDNQIVAKVPSYLRF